MVARPRPHDIFVCDVSRLQLNDSAPEWVRTALASAPVVVVRNAAWKGEMIPVGVRGDVRHARFAFFLAPEAVLRHVTPEQLAKERAWKTCARGELPPIAELPLVEAALWKFGFLWGPTGSVGFELVSGRPTVTPNSDLDLLIRLPERISADEAARLHATLTSDRVRVDVRVRLPAGYASLVELARGEPELLVRTATGPVILRDPWVRRRVEARPL